ncbi:MAG: AAA family ATPase [Bacteroidota bacterium]
MIIILNGALGVGKTSVSWALNQLLEPSVMLDGDYLGAVNPFDLHDPQRTAYLYRTVAHLIRFHQQHGFQYFIFNYVFEHAEALQQLYRELAPLALDTHSFLLECSPETQRQRISKRNNQQVEWELTRGPELLKIMAKAQQNGFIGNTIATEGKTPTITAREILNTIQHTTGP